MIGLLHIVDDMSALRYASGVQSVKIVYNEGDAAYRKEAQKGAQAKTNPRGTDSGPPLSEFQKKLISMISTL